MRFWSYIVFIVGAISFLFVSKKHYVNADLCRETNMISTEGDNGAW